MKTSAVGHFGFSSQASRGVLLALALEACREGATRRSENAEASGGGPGGTRAMSARAAGAAPSPAFQAELARRRTAWVEKPPAQGDNKMTLERLRRVEMSRFELTSLAQEAAMMDMGLGEVEQARLRQILRDFRDAALLRIEHAADGKDTSGAQADEALDGIEGRSQDPSALVNVYARKLHEALGDARHGELKRFEREERAKLIAARRDFRRAPAPPAPLSSQVPGLAPPRP